MFFVSWLLQARQELNNIKTISNVLFMKSTPNVSKLRQQGMINVFKKRNFKILGFTWWYIKGNIFSVKQY